MAICFIFNYFYPICPLASSRYCEPPCLCSRAGMLHSTMENAGRAEQSAARWGQGPSGAQGLQKLGEHGTATAHSRTAQHLSSFITWPPRQGIQVARSTPLSWLTHSSPRAAAWTLGFRRKKRILPAIPFMGAGSRIIILCSSQLLSPPNSFFNKWKHTRRAQHLLSELLYSTDLFQPSSQLFPCQQLYHCAIPLPTHKCTGWRYELESLP